jgi:hypothetical protein
MVLPSDKTAVIYLICKAASRFFVCSFLIAVKVSICAKAVLGPISTHQEAGSTIRSPKRQQNPHTKKTGAAGRLGRM